MRSYGSLSALFFSGLWCFSCTTVTKEDTRPSLQSAEIQPVLIPLAGAIAEPETEISGLAWFQDQLIVLPQYLGRHNARQHLRLFSFQKAELESFVRNPSSKVLSPREIPVDIDRDLENQIAGFEGYEAIVFSGREVFLLIEAETDSTMTAFLVKGEMNASGSRLQIQSRTLTEVPLPAQLSNMAHETMVRFGNELLVIYEANGKKVNPEPVAYRYSKDLKLKQEIPFESLEYRITDATEADSLGRFWVTNYFWKGEKELLQPEEDPDHVKHGKGRTHRKYQGVERLVQFEFKDAQVRRTPARPLEFVQEEKGKNWEGIVRLGELGFLVATDKHPTTLLAFVPFPSEEER